MKMEIKAQPHTCAVALNFSTLRRARVNANITSSDDLYPPGYTLKSVSELLNFYIFH